jgi:hypothetical protein
MKTILLKFSIVILMIISSISLKATCSASFTWDQIGLRNVQFTSTSTGSYNPAYSLWRFGDGTTYTGAGNPSKNYSTYGTKNVCLILRDSSGNVCDSICNLVRVDSCFGTFRVTYNCRDSIRIEVQHGLTTVANIYWGDGTSTFTGMGAAWNTANFSHKYTTSGIYNITLAIPMFFGPCSGISDTFRSSVMINIPPVPLFNTVQIGDSVDCTHTSGGLISGGFGTPTFGLLWWNFGDGSSYFFADMYPDTTKGHRYTSPGTYVIKHWITNFATSGPWCASDTTYDTVVIGCATRAGFYLTPSSPIVVTSVPTAIQLFNTTSGRTVNTIYQILVDGSLYANISYMPVFTMLIDTYGTHTICMLAYDTVTHCLDDTCINVSVLPPGGCNAVFNYTVNCNTLTFFNTSTGASSYLWNFGDGSTSSITNPVHSYTDTSTFVYFITLYALDTSGNVCDSVRQIVTIPHFDTISGFVWNDINGNGFKDGTETFRAGQQVRIYDAGTTTLRGTFNTTSLGQFRFYMSVGNYDIELGPLPSTSHFQTYPASPSRYTVSSTGSCDHIDDLRFGVVDSSYFRIYISGYVYEDNNNNGIKDIGEPGFSGQRVYIGPYSALTTSSGFYYIVVPRNPYTISYFIPSSLAGFTHTSPSVINLVPIVGVTGYPNNNFGINDTIPINNLCADLVPVTNVSPLGPIWYRLYVNNTGTTVMSGTATMYYDPRYVYNSSSPAGVHDGVGHSITFTFSGLAAHSFTTYFIRFNNPITLVAGDAVFNVAFVDAAAGITEIEYACNMDTLHQLVEASWDPNDKSVSPIGVGAGGQISDNTKLDYTIRFQNTGTAAAVNIVLIDTISPNLDLETFELRATSHDVRTQIEGRTLKFFYDDIMLPDSTSDPEGSNGFVAYSINTIPFSTEGTVINNTADIYFDLNVPVRTNTTLNTITYKLSIENIDNNIHFNAYPNPFDSYINFSMDGLSNSNAQIVIYDIEGKKVAEKNFVAQNTFTKIQIETSQLTGASYIYQLIQNNKVLSEGKLIRQ